MLVTALSPVIGYDKASMIAWPSRSDHCPLRSARREILNREQCSATALPVNVLS